MTTCVLELECQVVRSLTPEHQSLMISLENALSQNDSILKRSHRLGLLQCLQTLELIDAKLKFECELIKTELTQNENRVIKLPLNRQLVLKLLKIHTKLLGQYTLNTVCSDVAIKGLNQSKYDQYRGFACLSSNGLSINSHLNPIMVKLKCLSWFIRGHNLQVKGSLPESIFRLQLIKELNQLNLPGQLASAVINYDQNEPEI